MKNPVCVSEYRINAPVQKSLKLLFISDLHNYPNEPIFEAIKAIKSDAILVGGDFISERKNSKRDCEFFDFAVDTAPTFCILGNHEKRYKCDTPKMIENWVIKTGAVLLDNEYVQFEGLNIGGLTSTSKSVKRFYTPPPDSEWLAEFSKLAGYKILLSHHPEHYDKYIKPFNIDLVLSGHAHGGQWRIFGHGIFAPGQGIFPKYTSGMYDKRFIVCRGLGNKCHIPRINNKPEILLLNIERF